jgi:hypothetical protein
MILKVARYLINPILWGLFKNVQMQGTQKTSREAYIDIR